jgi:hypothetical protein
MVQQHTYALEIHVARQCLIREGIFYSIALNAAKNFLLEPMGRFRGHPA